MLVVSSVKTLSLTLLAIPLMWPEPARGAVVTDLAQAAPTESTFVMVRGRVDLPPGGIWEVRSATDASVHQLYLIPPRQALGQQLGSRSTAALREQRIDQARWKVRILHEACLEFAREHDGIGPASVNDLDRERFRYVIEHLDEPPWWDWNPATDGPRPSGPFVFLVPRARFHFEGAEGGRVPPEHREVLAIELRPYVDDGRHWVLYTDGACVREPIQSGRVEGLGIEIRPILAVSDPLVAAPGAILPYTLVAVRQRSATGSFEVNLRNPVSGAEETVVWPAGPAEEDPTVLDALRAGREHAWQPYLRAGPAPVLRTWLSTGESLPDDPGRRPDDSLTTFALLGGRTAVEETLQLQNLEPQGVAGAATIPVSSLSGVAVRAHPFAEMLGDRPGGRLELADLAPPDRFFLYVAQPAAILPFLDKGSGFLAAAGAGFTGNRLDYGLTGRYLERLGMNRAWLETVLRSGLIRDLALLLPDLFLIDGTDLTVIVRLDRPDRAGALWSLLGRRGIEGTVLPVPAGEGRQAFWTLEGNLLCLSTHRAELDRVLELIRHDGEGSLGRSDEFRYMLTQLPVRPDTRFFAYFSDPFVRRLVGPEVKLGQMRRIQARARMEAVTAQALLARLDGTPPARSAADLVRSNHLPGVFPAEPYTIDERGIVHSATYGTLDGLKTLFEAPVDRVTAAEAEAYRRYVENYSRFWSQFFDPIAMRLDDTDGFLELTTFILPLIDNSIYNGLRETLLRHEDPHPLVLPVVDPTPVLQFSMNLQDRVWQSIAGGFGDLFRRYGGASPALLDDLGPAVHLSVFDADPVIALGSGDLLGAFGGETARLGGLGRSDMVLLPVALSVLTRPCTLRVETRDAEQTARFLRQAAAAGFDPVGRDNDFAVAFHQVNDRDAWVWSLSISGMIKLRFGVEVTDRHLVLRNLPWTTPDRAVRLETAPLNGAGLTLWPTACALQLPSLFASAADQEQRATLAGLGRLHPLMACGAADADAAGDWHRQLFGFRPLAVPGDAWHWQDGHAVSGVYGSVHRPRQPGYAPDRPFGLMQTIDLFQLTMQFEDAGLRSLLRWKLRP